MQYPAKTFLVLIYTVFTIVFGVAIFLNGFLLRRAAFSDHTSCPSNSSHCSIPAVYNRAIILLVDALRDDFLDYNVSLVASDARAFQNRMRHVHWLLTQRPRHTVRFRFVADAPTTTHQRILALATGSLPTFVDVSSSFDPVLVTEDSWLWQANASGAHTWFVGDDTWMAMFPGVFDRARPFPSFDIADLDTVDAGVIAEFGSVLSGSGGGPTGDWRLLVGHMLGVDHCGHTYHSDHSCMARKLSQVDHFIKNITETMGDDTILFVMGDHGMTETGDHGGETEAEVSAGMLVVSSRPLPDDLPRSRSIWQVDFAPTLSCLLGLPVPFSSVGSVREELIPRHARAHALAVNVRQVSQLVERLQLSGNQFSGNQFPGDQLSGDKSEEHRRFLRGVLAACQAAWTRFDLWQMTAGVAVLATIAVASAMGAHFLAPPLLLAPLWLPVGACVGVLLLLLLAVTWQLLSVSGALIGGGLVSMGVCAVTLLPLSRQQRPSTKIDIGSILSSISASVVLTLRCLVFFSNSFVIGEDSISAFCVVTLLLVVTVTALRDLQTRGGYSTPAVLCVAVLALSTARVSLLGAVCREEQRMNGWCSSPSTPPIASSRGHVMAAALMALVSVIAAHRRLLHHWGSMNGHSVGVVATRCCLPLAAVSIFSSWILQSAEESPLRYLVEPWHQLTPLLLTAGSVLGLTLTLLWRPLLVLVASSRDGSLVERIFHRLKLDLAASADDGGCQGNGSLRSAEQQQHQLCVYGLAAGVTAPLSSLLLGVWLLLLIPLGPQSAVPAALLVANLAAVLALMSLTTRQNLWLYAMLWSELASLHFFATGHQTALSSIRWNSVAALTPIGVSTGVGKLLAAVCVIADTFSADIIFAATLPLLVVTPALLQYMAQKRRGTSAKHNGELQFLLQPHSTSHTLLKLNILYLSVRAAKLFFCCLAASVLRRHLMVWQIFTPRLIFESISFVVCALSCLTSHCVTLRCINYGSRWLDRLSQRQLV